MSDGITREPKCPGCKKTGTLQVALDVVEYNKIESLDLFNEEVEYGDVQDTMVASSGNERFYCKPCNKHFSWHQVIEANVEEVGNRA